MTAEDLFKLAMRVIGVWVLVSAVESTAYVVAMISTSERARIDIVVEVGVTALTKSALAVILLLYAPAVTSWFNHKQAESTSVRRSFPISVRDTYQIVARILGLFSFLSAIKPASSIASEIFGTCFWDEFSSGSWQWAFCVQTTSYLVCGMLLVFWAPKIADLFARTHETDIEKQRSA